VLHRYDMVIGGLALQVPEKDIGQLATLSGFEAVYRDPQVHGDSEKAPPFIGAPPLWNGLGGRGQNRRLPSRWLAHAEGDQRRRVAASG
jgi:hypothetical protein